MLLAQSGQSATATLNNVSPVGTGTHQIKATYIGNSNFSPSTSSTVGITAQTVVPTLALATAPSTSTFSQQVLLTANLSPSTEQGLSTNGETITFLNGFNTLGTSTLSSGVATLNLTSLPAGNVSLSAFYPGDTNLSTAKSNTVSYTVTQATPVVSWVPPSSAIYTGKAIGSLVFNASSTTPGTFTYTATLSGGSPTPLTTTTILASGSYTLSATLAPSNKTDFTTVSQSAPFTALDLRLRMDGFRDLVESNTE